MQTIKDTVLRLLNVYVEPYVENLNRDDLSLSVFGGAVQFRGLHLKKTLLERFGLPVDIVAGDIGNLSLTIPWTQLKTQPVKIVIDDVYVLARARPPGKVDKEESERIEQATKQERLRKAETVENAASQVGHGAQTEEAKQSYIGAIISKVVDNVQIHVKGVHLRYEDGTSTPEHPFAAGLTLAEFKAVSTDGNWVEAFIQDSLHGVHKLVKLEALSVYFDTDTGSLDRGPADRAGTLDALKQMLAGSPNHQHILRPVTGEARIILNKLMSSETPKMDAQILFDEIGVAIDRDQYRDVLSVNDVFHFYSRTRQYVKYRPPESEYEANPARARCKFAFNAVRLEIHERRRRATWDYIFERRDRRKRYVEVFVRKLALPEGKALAPEDATALADLETCSSYEDIRLFRYVAVKQAKEDAATRRKLEAEKKAAQQPRQTWGQWLWGTGPTEAEDGGMTEEQKKEIDDIIDFDAEAAARPAGTIPMDFMKARVSAKLNKGSFSLRVDPHGKNTDIIALVFDTFTADALQLTEAVSGKLALGGFRVYDGTRPDSLYPQIVRVKDIENKKGKSRSRQTSLQADGTAGALSALGDDLDGEVDAEHDPFFVLEVDHKPLDGRADNAVSVKMRHLEIIYHKTYVEMIYEFLKPPASQMESVTAFMTTANRSIDGIRKETRAGLEYALDNHKTLDVKVDMNAPIVIIPMDVAAKESQALVLDAGHISVESKLADEKDLKELRSKRGRQYNVEDEEQLKTLMYDRFKLQLQAAQLLMGPSVDSCMGAIEDHHASGESDLHILERINMSFTILLAMVNSADLTKFKIEGDLPELQLNFSDRKYQTLMRFIDVAVPNFPKDVTADLPSIQDVTAQALPSFRPHTVEEYTLDDTRSIQTDDDADAEAEDPKDDSSSVDDKGGDQFYEARDDIADSQRAALEQVTFEFSFSVGKLQTSLYKSISDTVEKPLADATLEGFGLTFAQRKYDMSVDLFLKNVTLAMTNEGGATKRPLLSSAEDSSSAASSDLKLVRVKYLKTQKDSPEFMTLHEGNDQDIDVELSTFKITLAPEPILSLYDFIMTTFVPKDNENANAKAEQEAKQEDQAAQQASSDKLKVRVKLTSAQVSLENNDNIFALLALPSADVVVLLRSGTMRVTARLGSLSLEDLSDSSVADPAFKRLLAIEGGDLADFSYETYDPSAEAFPGYNSSITLRAGSFKFTFMEQPIRDLYTWATKFARMKAIYDAASQAAVQRASEVTRIQYDVEVKTPIIVLPRDGTVSPDRLVLRLGEIFAKNEYLKDANDTSTVDAGLRGINVTSEMIEDDRKSALQLVNDVAITAKIKQAGGKTHRNNPDRADSEITADMSDVKLSLTARQYVLLMDVLKALPRALSLDDVEDDDELSASVTPVTPSYPSTPAGDQTPKAEDHLVNLEPELAIVNSRDGEEPALWNALDLVFDVGSIALEVYDADAQDESSLKAHSIARFALVKSHLGYKRLSDGATEAEFTLGTLAFSNTRSGNSVFRDIIPHTTQNGNQIMVQYTMSGGTDSSSLAIVTVDSPKFILAIEPLAALLEFALAPFKATPGQEQQPAEDDQQAAALQPVEGPTSTSSGMAFRVNIVHATVTVLANDSDPKSQAIELSINEVLLSQQSILAFKIDKLGMAFGRMDRPDARVRFLDDLNVALSLDTRRRGSQQMTSFEVEIPDAIIFRASYSDIMLIIDIVNKATAVANKALSNDKPAEPDMHRRQSSGGTDMTSTRAPATTTISPAQRTVTANTTRRSSVSRRRKSVDQSKVLVSKEQLKATINGFQFVLIGDVQEMPMVHLSTNEFSVMVNDWSGDMKMATSLTTGIRYFNLANSYFEPLMDPWTFDIRAQRTSISPESNPLSVRISAAERLEVNLTSSFVELAITSMTMWSKHGDKIKEGRGNDAPFRLRNHTGMTILVWPESRDLNKKVTGVKSLDDGADVPWRFENAIRARENVSALRHNALGVQLKGGDMQWESIRNISVDRAGEQIKPLRPRIDKVQHQIACDIKLENNIKVITFRSTLNIENETNLPIEMIVVDSHGKAATGALRIDPGQSMPMPLIDAYDKRFRIRPLKGFNFDYSWSLPLHWRQLMSRPVRSISCKHQTPKEPAFFFQGQANFDEKDPVTRQYPRMTLRLRAPLEIENLLPYDIRFRIHDKHSGLSSSNFLTKGLASPIHTVEVSHLMLISITAEDTNLQQSDYAIIGSDDPELPQEDHFHMSDQQGHKLMLKLHYFTYPESGGAFKVQIYSPYIFLNKTGLPFDLAAKTWSGGSKPIAGSDLFANDYTHDTPTPFMFGYLHEDRRNRLLLKVGDTKWSKPLSFEPVSADMQIVLASQNAKTDTYVGLSYSEGLGKYKLTKVITIAPRFMVKNMFSYALKVRQHSTSKVVEVKPGETLPIHELQSSAPTQLSMAFDQPSLKWSAPFNLADIGRTNLALQRMTANHGERTYLMRVEAHIQGSSIFTYISRETEPWPLKIRNDTNLKLSYQQVDDDGSKQKHPLREVRPKGEAEYAWDLPTAPNKRLQLACDGVPLPRNIDMMAIGIQPPMKVSAGPQTHNKSIMVTTDIQADGSSQLLVISHYDAETSVYKPAKKGTGAMRRSDSTDSIATTSFETVAVSEKPNFSLTVELEGIGLSVVTKTPAELFYLSLRGLKLGYSDYPQYYEAHIDCKWIQIDNQLFGGLFPIILYPSMIPKDGKELESHPTLQSTVAVLKDQSHGVVFVKYATILLQSMTVELDEDFLFALLDFVKFKDAAWKEPPADVLIEHPKNIPEPDITSGQADVFFEALHLQPVALELSFMRTDRVNVDEQLNSGGVFYYILNALTMTLGNVNAAPVSFRSLLLENVRLSIPSLQERVVLHYQEQFVAQIYRVLGSADFLGNPVGLFTNISSGFSDIFYEPYQGMVMHGNMDIGFGLARGWSSFAKKTVFGISDSVTKVTSSIGKGLSAATLDSEYQTKRRMAQRRNKPKHALYGVAAGASAFANSMTSAFEGVAAKPLEGAQTGGGSGFVKGMGQGVVGLFTKPAVGLFDFVSASTEGIRNTTTVFDQGNIDRARLPRFISSDGVLRTFSAREALGQSWLKELEAGAYFHDSYVAHLDTPGDDSVAILSNNCILSVSLRKLKVGWTVPFEELQSLSLESDGIALIWRDGKPGPYMAIPDKAGRDWFFKAIAKVVNIYNDQHRNA